MMRRASRSRWTIIAATALGVSAAVLPVPSPAFLAPVGSLPGDGLVIHWAWDPSMTAAGFLWPSAYAADQAWTVAGLDQQVRIVNDDSVTHHPVRVGFVDGPESGAAIGTKPCRSDAVTCEIRFETGYGNTWNTTTELRDSSWLDFVAFATHEFGHWIGLDHSSDYPSTDNRKPTMWRYPISEMRTIQQDDINGLRTARPTYAAPNLLSNGHFGWTYADWGGTDNTTWIGRQAVGWSLPWDSDGNRYLAFGGNGASVHQDLYIYNGNYVSGRTMTPRARFRFPNGGSVTVAVWALDTAQLVYQRTCSVGAGSTWREIVGTTWSAANCTGNVTFVEPTTSIPMRIEIYNNSPTSVINVDHVRVQF